MKYILALLLMFVSLRAQAASTAEQTTAGFLSSSSIVCASIGLTPTCFVPYSTTNPMPISLGTSSGVIAGSGATNYVARWTGTTTLGTGVLYDNGTNVGIGSTSPTAPLVIGSQAITDTGVLLQATSSVAGYNQFIIQNTNGASNASTNYVVNNDLGTSSTYYGEFGMNSSGFTGVNSFSQANTVYLDSQSGDLAIGTLTSNAIHFVIGNSAADAMTIGTSGQVNIPLLASATTSAVFMNNFGGL